MKLKRQKSPDLKKIIPQMDRTLLNNNQKAFVTEVALEVYNVLSTAFDNAEIEIDKLRKELPPEYEEDVDLIVNKVYHNSVDLINEIKESILNLTVKEIDR